MFTSKDDLKLEYGVDMEIGKFLTDREVPENNLYWKERLLYILPMSGYLFIPVYIDLQFRIGLPKSELLSEPHLKLMEAILHSAAKEESKLISMEEHVAECIALAQPVCRNPALLHDLTCYFSGRKDQCSVALGTKFRSLNRADAYLFSLCYFDVSPAVTKKLIDAWYALIAYYLLIDDLKDLQSDYENQEDNALLEAGLNTQGAEAIDTLLTSCYEVMSTVNPVIANRIDHKRQTANVKRLIDDFLQQQSISAS